MQVFPLSLRSALFGACALMIGTSAADEEPVQAATTLTTAPMPQSKGVYRVPYADGTGVRVGRDHNTHTPKGRYDMNGQGGGTYRIVAAADGRIRHIEDRYSKRLSCKDLPASEQKNNYVWIEHANGESTKYSHMTKGSSTGKAKLKLNQFVKAGTYLGDQGEVGCAKGPHLHVEVAVLRANDPITQVGGFAKDNAGSKRNRIMRLCGGGMFVAGQTHTARKLPGAIPPGASEVARHGVPAADYQCLFDQASQSGYALEWIDGFDIAGKVYYNAVFRPAGPATLAFHGLTAAQYQKQFDTHTHQGYRPYQVDVYTGGGGLRYAAIFRKGSGPAFRAYHGLSEAQHQQRMTAWTKEGYRPRNVSVASSANQRRYAAIYEKTDLGSWQAKSQLTAAQYQQEFNANTKAKRGLAYLNAYMHGGQPYFSAIWSSKANGSQIARHGLTGAQYQTEWESATGTGYRTRSVSGYGAGGAARYAAVWRK